MSCFYSSMCTIKYYILRIVYMTFERTTQPIIWPLLLVLHQFLYDSIFHVTCTRVQTKVERPFIIKYE